MHEEYCNLFHFIQQSTDDLTIEVKKFGLLHECQTINEFRSEKLNARLRRYKLKPLHGYYERVCSEVWN